MSRLRAAVVRLGAFLAVAAAGYAAVLLLMSSTQERLIFLGQPPRAEVRFAFGADVHERWVDVPRALLRHPLRTDDALARAAAPVALIHGGADNVMPFAHSERLHAGFPHARLVRVAGGGHNDLPALRHSTTRCAKRSRHLEAGRYSAPRQPGAPQRQRSRPSWCVSP